MSNKYFADLSKNRTTISDIPFVVVLGNDNPGHNLGTELVSWSDSYVFVPDGMPLVKDVISRAVDGKRCKKWKMS